MDVQNVILLKEVLEVHKDVSHFPKEVSGIL